MVSAGSGCARCSGTRCGVVPGGSGGGGGSSGAERALLAAEAELLRQDAHQQASQKPYRVGLVLLCVGALFNWLGLAQAYVEPMRYLGVACIVAGALLICAAMCRWLGRSGLAAGAAGRTAFEGSEEYIHDSEGGHVPPSVHVITLPHDEGELQVSKPPDYDSLVAGPPSYEDALKLGPRDVEAPPPPPSATPAFESSSQGPRYEELHKEPHTK